jgi:hypothetical protein
MGQRMKIGDKVIAKHKDALGHETLYDTYIVSEGRGGYDWMCYIQGLHIGFKEQELQHAKDDEDAEGQARDAQVGPG